MKHLKKFNESKVQKYKETKTLREQLELLFKYKDKWKDL